MRRAFTRYPLLLSTAVVLSMILTAASVPVASAEPAVSDGPEGRPQRLVPFEIEDQFGKQHTYRDFVGQPLLIIAADGGASGHVAGWSGALTEMIERLGGRDQLAMVGLADLRAVPAAFRGNVERSFSRDPAAWTLLDWKGAFANSYAFEKNHCNLLLFGPDGTLLMKAAGREVDPDVVARVEGHLEPLLGQAQSE